MVIPEDIRRELGIEGAVVVSNDIYNKNNPDIDAYWRDTEIGCKAKARRLNFGSTYIYTEIHKIILAFLFLC